MFAKATVFDRENKQELEISIFTVAHKVNGKLQGFFHHEAWLHGEMSVVRAPLGAAGDLSEQALFLW